MSAWNPHDYLRFERERTLPCRDLASRIELSSPLTIVDLGCGPGNSTAVLAQRWPNSKIIGIDNSPQMLKIARKSKIRVEWLQADVRQWKPSETFDLIFSNAALQWITNHETELPRIFNYVTEGGAFAFQVPTRTDLWYEVLQKVLNSRTWKEWFRDQVQDFDSRELPIYYDILSSRSTNIDLWETEYFHVLPEPSAVVEWTRGTALRSLLDRLPDAKTRDAFVADYTKEIALSYPKRSDGRILFPFLRRFVISYR